MTNIRDSKIWLLGSAAIITMVLGLGTIGCEHNSRVQQNKPLPSAAELPEGGGGDKVPVDPPEVGEVPADPLVDEGNEPDEGVALTTNPTVVETSPADGATVNGKVTEVSITFSETINEDLLKNGVCLIAGLNQPLRGSYDPSNIFDRFIQIQGFPNLFQSFEDGRQRVTFRFTPDSLDHPDIIAYGVVLLSKCVQDLDENNMEELYTWGFSVTNWAD